MNERGLSMVEITFNTNPQQKQSFTPMTIPAPIFPDFNYNSLNSEKMANAKRINNETFWPVMREVFAHDFNTLPLERFKVWASTMTVPFMAGGDFKQYVDIANQIIDSGDELYINALLEPMIGLTEEDFTLYSSSDRIKTTLNRMMNIAHLVICNITSDDLSKMNTIVELGGGIGEMADVVYKLGFKGKYILYDFPEIGNIQKWFHDQLGHTNILHTSNIDDLIDADLCIATWSFTEMPLSLRNELMEKIGKTKNWLIAYSNYIFSIDNNDYIKNTFAPQFTNHEFTYIDVPFMPWNDGTFYLTVKQKTTGEI